MTEEDIKLNFITPAILAKGWLDKITMETKVKFTDGKVNLRGNKVSRETPKKPTTYSTITKTIRSPWLKQKTITIAYLSACNRQCSMLKCSTSSSHIALTAMHSKNLILLPALNAKLGWTSFPPRKNCLRAIKRNKRRTGIIGSRAHSH